jgi:hypothetical protein
VRSGPISFTLLIGVKHLIVEMFERVWTGATCETLGPPR